MCLVHFAGCANPTDESSRALFFLVWRVNNAVVDISPLVAGLIVSSVCDVIVLVVNHHRLSRGRQVSHTGADGKPDSRADSGSRRNASVSGSVIGAPTLVHIYASVDVHTFIV